MKYKKRNIPDLYNELGLVKDMTELILIMYSLIFLLVFLSFITQKPFLLIWGIIIMLEETSFVILRDAYLNHLHQNGK